MTRIRMKWDSSRWFLPTPFVLFFAFLYVIVLLILCAGPNFVRVGKLIVEVILL